VTLPLSYSRLGGSPASPFAASAWQARNPHSRQQTVTTVHFRSEHHRRGLPSRSSLRSSERRLVAREGLEPSKPLGRQIYSLLRLTASLPRQLAVVLENELFPLYLRPGSSVDGAGEGIRTPDLLITNQLLYQTELRQPRQKVNFSTSRATLQLPACAG
jgi:hypothetical protein